MTNQQCAFVFDRPGALRNAFQTGCTHFVEISDEPQQSVTCELYEDNSRILQLFSKSVYEQPVAQLISQELRVRLADVETNWTENVATALHEALMNAVIHGNLGLSKSFETPEQLAGFDQKIRDKLTDPQFARKPVHIRSRRTANSEIVFEITDQGQGFDYRKVISEVTGMTRDELLQQPKHHGMGLPLMLKLADDVAFANEGRTICLTFSLPKVSFEPSEMTVDSIAIDHRERYMLLIVDDMTYNRDLISQILDANGFSNLMIAENTADALSLIESHVPNLIISNLHMDGLSGTQLCQAIRLNPTTTNVPVILHSAMAGIDERISAFESGANDLMEQPLNEKELIVRLQTHLSQYLAYQKLQEYRNRIESELELARQMHMALIPEAQQLTQYQSSHGMIISNFFQPSSEIGGDVWGIFDIDEDRLGIYMCDFTGHGVGAAINTFRFHTAIQPMRSKGDPSAFLGEINQLLYRMLPVTQFATFFYGIIDRKKDKMYYSAAGAPRPFLYSVKSGNTQMIDSSGVPLGIVAEQNYETHCVDFHPGDTMLLYSDALVESPTSDGSFLEESDIAEIMQDSMPQASEKAQKNTMRQFMNLLGIFEGNQCDDDLTIAFFTREK